MQPFMIALCLLTLGVCGFTLYTVSDLDRQIDRIGTQSHDYNAKLRQAAQAFDSVKESADLRELLIKCDAFAIENAKPGILETTSFQMMAAACNAAVGINKAALVMLVSSNALAEALENRAARLEGYLIGIIALAAIIPGVLVVVVLSLFSKKYSLLQEVEKRSGEARRPNNHS